MKYSCPLLPKPPSPPPPAPFCGSPTFRPTAPENLPTTADGKPRANKTVQYRSWR